MAEDERSVEKEWERNNNAVLFRTAVEKCFKNIAESVSAPEFTEIMTVLEGKAEVLEKMRRVMARQLYEGMRADLEETLAEGNLTSGLARVSKLAQRAADRPEQIAWRPPGNVERHLRNLDAERIKALSDELEQRLLEIEADNERLTRRVSEGRGKIRSIRDRVDRSSKILPDLVPRLEKTLRQLRELVDAVENT